MATVVAEEELYRSCRIIFGPDLKVSSEFLQYLQLSGIKKAYRQKALEMHPDRGACQSLTLQQSMAHKFIDVHEAYKKLVAYLEARDNGRNLKNSPASLSRHKDAVKAGKQRNSRADNCKSSFQGKAKSHYSPKGQDRQGKPPLYEPPLDPKSLYKGPMPNCPLLFGRYLYYSGIISLHTIGQALIWQRSQRPRFGEIGRRLGLLSEQDTFRILQNRRERQLFGELALSLGLLTREQLHRILLQQKRLHKRIGQYFVAENYWDVVKLEEYVAAHNRHNSRVRERLA